MRGREDFLRQFAMPAPFKFTLPKKSPPQGGRPCLLTPSCKAILLKAIEEGMPLKQAAMAAGVSYDSMNRWRKRGESENEPLMFRKFCKELQRSEAIAMQRLIGRIQAAGETDWKASAWMLEKRFPEEFGKVQRVEHSAPEANPMEGFATVEPEVLRRMKKQANVVKVIERLGAILLKNRAQNEIESQRKAATRLRE